MPNQQKTILRKNFAPSVSDFLGTDDPIQQREQILAFASLQNAQLSAAFINAGGSWQEWDNTAAKSCDVNRKTTEVFTRAVNGDMEAVKQIALDLNMDPGYVATLIGSGQQETISQGEQHYSETLTMRDLIPTIGRGVGLYNESL